MGVGLDVASVSAARSVSEGSVSLGRAVARNAGLTAVEERAGFVCRKRSAWSVAAFAFPNAPEKNVATTVAAVSVASVLKVHATSSTGYAWKQDSCLYQMGATPWVLLPARGAGKRTKGRNIRLPSLMPWSSASMR